MSLLRSCSLVVAFALAASAVTGVPAPAARAATGAVLPGFDSQVIPGNDDGSTAVDLPFPIEFFGQSYSSAYLNNNGNITFDRPRATYTPYPLSDQGPPMIAAFFADVDTRAGNQVTYGEGTVDGRPAFGATWPAVACFEINGSVRNTFQLLLIDRSDVRPGDFDIEFNYEQIQWDSGQASGGDARCQHGTPARAGYAGGSGATGTYYELPGSGEDGAFLDSSSTGLVRSSYGSTQPGRYRYQVRNGAPPLTSGAPRSATGTGSGSVALHDTTCNTARPVNCASGGFWHTFTDLTLPARGGPLAVTRTYNSLRAGIDGDFGYGWTWAFGEHLTVDAEGSATVTAADGSAVTAQPTGTGAFQLPTWAASALTREADGSWTFVDHRRLRKTFDASGRLTAVGDRNGETTTIEYRDGEVSRITDPAGRAITVEVSDGRVTGMTDPVGGTSRYAYEDDGDLASATDPAGATTTFSYDDDHRLLTMTGPRGGALTNTYDADGRVTEQQDPLGRRTRFAYSGDAYRAQGGTTTLTDPNGTVTTQDYVSGQLVAITKAAGTGLAATTRYTYDPTTLGVTTETGPRGGVTAFTYDLQGRLLSRTDPLGRRTTHEYDAAGDEVARTSPSGATTRFARDARGNLTSVTDAAGHTATLAHDDPAHPGDVTAVTDPDGRVTRSTYNAQGDQVTSSVSPAAGTTSTTATVFDAAGRPVCQTSATATAAGVACPSPGGARVAGTSTTAYDPVGRVVGTTDAEGRTTTREYDADGNLVSLTDPAGQRTRYTYDADGQMTSVERADGTTVAYAYDGNGNQVEQTDAAGAMTRYTFDALDRQTSVTDPLGRTTTTSYDAAGNRTGETNPAGETTAHEYDAADQLVATTYSDGTTPAVGYRYDDDGRRVTMTDGTGTTSYTYDPVGRLTAETSGSGATVRYGYDGAGHVTSLTYPGGQTVTRAYDQAARLVGVTDWLGGTFTFGYDADGNLTGRTDPNGVGVASRYDRTGQLSSLTQTRGAAALASSTYTRDGGGRLSGSTTAGAAGATTQTYGYTALDQLSAVGAARYSYDRADQLTGLVDGSTQTFDAANQLRSRTAPETRVIPSPSPAVDRSVSADSTGRTGLVSPTLTTAGPGRLLLASVSAAGPAGRAQQVTKVTGGGLTWSRVARTNTAPGTAEIWRAYATGRFSGRVTATLGVAGHPATITVTSFTGAAPEVGAKAGQTGVGGQPAVTVTPSKSGSLIVGAGQSLDSSRPCPSPYRPRAGQTLLRDFQVCSRQSRGWAQQVTAATVAGRAVTVGAASASRVGRWDLVAVEVRPAAPTTATANRTTSFTYDESGNRTGAGVDGAAPTTLAYDQEDRLVAYGPNATYAYDGNGLRVAKTVDGTTTSFAWDRSGDLPLLLTDGADAYVYGPDGLPLAKITGTTPTYLLQDQQGSTRLLVDAAGAVVGTYAYDPYGRVTAHTGPATSALQYNGQYTDAESGLQYLRARYYDPATGQFLTVDPLAQLSGSRYQYVNGNPLNYTDPTGMIGVLLGGIIGGTVGAAADVMSYAAGCGTDCSGRGYLGAAVGGFVGGAAAGACGPYAAVCGGVGGAVGEYLNQTISGSPTTDGWEIAEAGAFGAAGGLLGNRLVPQAAGAPPHKLNNLLHPGPNTQRAWQDSIFGAGVVARFRGEFNALLAPRPAC